MPAVHCPQRVPSPPHETLRFPTLLTIMAPLFRLGDDLLLDILSLLSPNEVVEVRRVRVRRVRRPAHIFTLSTQTCKYLSAVSSSRYLWNYLLHRDAIGRHAPLPCYRKDTADLQSSELEALTRRALYTASPTGPTVVTRFDPGCAQSVSWLRLVHGQYVLVAMSKGGKDSALALYTLLSIQENNKNAQSYTMKHHKHLTKLS